MRVRSLIVTATALIAGILLTASTSSAAFIVEAMAGGQNNSTNYHETGGWASSSGTVSASGVTAGATSRYSGTGSFFGPSRMAVYTFTAPTSDTYSVSLAWPSSAGQHDTVVDIYTGADNGNSTPDSFGNTGGPQGIISTHLVDMYYTGTGQWNLVDSIPMTAGTTYKVGIYGGHVTTTDTGTPNRVIAGAAEFAVVPEPASLGLLGLAGLGLLRRRRAA